MDSLLVSDWLYTLPPSNNNLYLFHVFHARIPKQQITITPHPS